MDPLDQPWRHAHDHQRVVLFLVRHGQTRWNATHRFLGQTDIPLDEVGVAQAKRAAARLTEPVPRPLAGVYSSPLSRALETARAVRAEPIVLDGLAELDQGALEGLAAPEAFERFPDFFRAWAQDPAKVRVPEGESLPELVERAMGALSEIAARHEPGEVVGVYSHQMVISALTCVAHGVPLSSWRDHRVGNTHATALSWAPDRPRVIVQRLPLGDEVAHA